MTALTVGITTARFATCKRGLAVNLAASVAREAAPGARVCVVDADPLELDVSTRLPVCGPVLEDFAERTAPAANALSRVHEPPLWVLPNRGGDVALTQQAVEPALRHLRTDFDAVICDLGRVASGPIRTIGGRLEGLDWLLLAITPDVEPVEAAAAFLAEFDAARDRGEIAESVRLGIVTTGDEGSVAGGSSTDLGPAVIARALGRPVLGSVSQLWGRAVPNVGFGAALAIRELDDAVTDLFGRLGAPIALDVSLGDAENSAISRAS